MQKIVRGNLPFPLNTMKVTLLCLGNKFQSLLSLQFHLLKSDSHRFIHLPQTEEVEGRSRRLYYKSCWTSFPFYPFSFFLAFMYRSPKHLASLWIARCFGLICMAIFFSFIDKQPKWKGVKVASSWRMGPTINSQHLLLIFLCFLAQSKIICVIFEEIPRKVKLAWQSLPYLDHK
jgi:hypothetical protein